MENADVSEERAASIIRTMTHHPGDVGSTHLRYVGQLQRDYMALYPRKLSLIYCHRENLKSHKMHLMKPVFEIRSVQTLINIRSLCLK
jgi:hypothetical protein